MRSRKFIWTTMVTAMSMAMTTSAFAGTWLKGAGENQSKWWYDNGNGAYTSNGWQWIDGNNDGVAECYYFDEAGWLMVGTTTPDGYTVNADGAWIQDGAVQKKSMNMEVAPISESDFVIGGTNSVTQNNADNSIITNWVRIGYINDPSPYHVFVSGDSLITARGISLGASKNDVTAKYGNRESTKYNAGSDKWYQFMSASGYVEANTIATATSVIDYTNNPYGIKFYFNQQEQLIGVVFYRDLTMVDNSNTVTNIDGDYNYYMSELYVKNEQTGAYELFKETKKFDKIVDYTIYENEVWYERSAIGLVADLGSFNYSVKTVATNDIIVSNDSDYGPTWHFALQGEGYLPIYYEENGQSFTGDFSGSDIVNCDGTTLDFASEQHIEEGYVLDELFGLGGRDVMSKEVYKKK